MNKLSLQEHCDKTTERQRLFFFFFLREKRLNERKRKSYEENTYTTLVGQFSQENFFSGKFRQEDDMTIKQNTQILSLFGLTLHAYEKRQEEAEGRFQPHAFVNVLGQDRNGR